MLYNILISIEEIVRYISTNIGILLLIFNVASAYSALLISIAR